MGEEEANKLADAASKTIETLQQMIDHKNDQLDRKEKIVDQLKSEILSQKQIMSLEIARLAEEIRSQAKGPMQDL